MTPREAILYVYGGRRNLMTPRVVGYGRIGPGREGPGLVYELSVGHGIVSHELYGVTVVLITGTGSARPVYHLSRAFSSRDAARAYIRSLRRQARQLGRRGPVTLDTITQAFAL